MTEAWREMSCAALAFMAADLHTYKTILFSGMPKTKAVVTHLAEGGKFSRAEVEANSEVSIMGLRHAGYSIDFIVGRYYEFAASHWFRRLNEQNPGNATNEQAVTAAYRSSGCGPVYGPVVFDRYTYSPR